jgi:Zn-dependent protease with chaperone function
MPDPAYSLPPEKLAKAIALNRQETWLQAVSLAWGFVSLLLILRLGYAAGLERITERWTSSRVRQGFFYLPLILLLITVLHLPIAIYGHHIGLAFGLSVQHWGSWLLDWAKSLGLTVVIGTLVFSILFAIIRRAPQLWWFWFWIASIPLTLISVFLVPVVIDPLFNHYEPLAQSNPALVAQLERVVQKSGYTIPPSRMFLMKASEKVTTANAYVTGFGSSKRVVVWDTTIHSSQPDGILFIFGHELGHYVLGHVLKGVFLSTLGSLIFLWLGYQVTRWLVRRFGRAWQVADVSDWSAVTVLLLVAGVLNFLSSPIENGVSRHFEHQADVYGQEVIHGIVADPQKTAQQSFQELGEDSLDIPEPNPLIVFWDYSHPTILQRATFARAYNPWAPGRKPKFFR